MKTLIYKEGNLLLDNDVQIIGHQANCQNTFGSGIARSIREMYPEAYRADCIATKNKTNNLGEISCTSVTSKEYNPSLKYIFNLYGQNLFGKGVRQTNYEALYSALEKMRDTIMHDAGFCDLRESVVGFPYQMGSFRGGGSWDVVSRLVEVAFDGYKGKVIIVALKS